MLVVEGLPAASNVVMLTVKEQLFMFLRLASKLLKELAEAPTGTVMFLKTLFTS